MIKAALVVVLGVVAGLWLLMELDRQNEQDPAQDAGDYGNLPVLPRSLWH